MVEPYLIDYPQYNITDIANRTIPTNYFDRNNNNMYNDVLNNYNSTNDYTTTTTTTTTTTNSSGTSCDTFKFIVNACVIGPLCLIGIIGNTVSLIILRVDRQNKTASMLLQTLALVDNFILVMSFILLSAIYSSDIAPVIQRTESLAPIQVLANAFQAASIWITVLLAINRYIAVCKPLKANLVSSKVVKMQIAVVFILSLLCNLPRWYFVSRNDEATNQATTTTNTPLLAQNIFDSGHPTTSTLKFEDTFLGEDDDDSLEYYETNFNHPIHQSQSQQQVEQQHQQEKQQQHQHHLPVSFLLNYNSTVSDNVTDSASITDTTNDNLDNVIYEIIYTIFVLVLPLIILIGLNCRLVKELKKLKTRLRNFSRHYKGSNEANITVVMIAIVMILVICHAPDRILQVSKFIKETSNSPSSSSSSSPSSSSSSSDSFPYCPTTFITLHNITNLMIIISFSINFVIYFVFRQRFRQILKYRMKYLCVKHDGGFPYNTNNVGKSFIYHNGSHFTHSNNYYNFNNNNFNNNNLHIGNNQTNSPSSASPIFKPQVTMAFNRHAHVRNVSDPGRRPVNKKYVITFRTMSDKTPQNN